MGLDLPTEPAAVEELWKLQTEYKEHVLKRGGRGVHSPLDRLRKGLSVQSRGIMRTEASA